MAPSYLRDFLQMKQATRYLLRSDEKMLLAVPTTRCKTFGDRSFQHSGPFLWNALPQQIRILPKIDYFKHELKTFLFKTAFNLI